MAEVVNQVNQAVAPLYSRHPGQFSRGIINFDSKIGWKHWKLATAQLQDELYQFMKSLKNRASITGGQLRMESYI